MIKKKSLLTLCLVFISALFIAFGIFTAVSVKADTLITPTEAKIEMQEGASVRADYETPGIRFTAILTLNSRSQSSIDRIYSRIYRNGNVNDYEEIEVTKYKFDGVKAELNSALVFDKTNTGVTLTDTQKQTIANTEFSCQTFVVFNEEANDKWSSNLSANEISTALDSTSNRTMKAVANVALFEEKFSESVETALLKFFKTDGRTVLDSEAFIEEVGNAYTENTLTGDLYLGAQKLGTVENGTVDITDTSIEKGKGVISVFSADGSVSVGKGYYATKAIRQATDLEVFNLTNATITGYYVLASDIDATNVAGNTHSGLVFASNKVTVNSSTYSFSGIFDGNNHSVAVQGSKQGIFGYLNGSTIKDVTFEFVETGANGFNGLANRIGNGKSSGKTYLDNVTVVVDNFATSTKDTNTSHVLSHMIDNYVYITNTKVFAFGTNASNTSDYVLCNRVGDNWETNGGLRSMDIELYYDGPDASIMPSGEDEITVKDNSLLFSCAEEDKTFDFATWLGDEYENAKNLLTSLTVTAGGTALTADLENGTLEGLTPNIIGYDSYEYGYVAGGDSKVYDVSGVYLKPAVIKLTTDDSVIYTAVKPCTRVIDEASDFAIFDIKTNSTKINGYYILGNNIDASAFNGNTHAGLTLSTPGTSAQEASSFNGVFDGNGYSINNLKASDKGLFGSLNKAIIKNVRINVTSGTAGQNILAGTVSYGSAKNSVKFFDMYVDYSGVTDGVDINFASRIKYYTVFNNVIFKTNVQSASVTQSVISLNRGMTNQDSLVSYVNFNNVYVLTASNCPIGYVADNSGIAIYAVDDGASDKTTKYKSYPTGLFRYASETDMNNAGKDYSAFNTLVWTVNENSIPQWKK